MARATQLVCTVYGYQKALYINLNRYVEHGTNKSLRPGRSFGVDHNKTKNNSLLNIYKTRRVESQSVVSGFTPYVVVVGDECVDSCEGEADGGAEAHGAQASGALVQDAGGGGRDEGIRRVLLITYPCDAERDTRVERRDDAESAACVCA